MTLDNQELRAVASRALSLLDLTNLKDDCTPEQLSSAVLRWFREPEAVAALQPIYRRLHGQLRQDASASAAAAVAELVFPSPVGAT